MVREDIPVVIFAHSRPEHLTRMLGALRNEGIPKLVIFSDGPKEPSVAERVAQVRRVARSMNWVPVTLVERESNLGLGKSILTGMGEVFSRFEAAVVLEDDLEWIPGMYRYLREALQAYAQDPRVFSVTGWTHPLITPRDVGSAPYFDARAECLSWGSWRRSWVGMERTAIDLMRACRDRYYVGADLVGQAYAERRKNIWAARWSFLHLLHGALCLRPPWTMVNHLGYDQSATNVSAENQWAHATLPESAPPIPENWPEPKEHREVARLWRNACGGRPSFVRHLFRSAQMTAIERIRSR